MGFSSNTRAVNIRISPLGHLEIDIHSRIDNVNIKYFLGIEGPVITSSGGLNGPVNDKSSQTVLNICAEVEKRMGGKSFSPERLDLDEIQTCFSKEMFRIKISKEIDEHGVSMEDAISIVQEHFVEKDVVAA